MALKIGLHRSSFYTQCVACGARYRPKFFYTERDCVGSDDHVCDPVKLKKRENVLKHEFDDESPYCECDDLDCKFEYLEQIKNEMQ